MFNKQLNSELDRLIQKSENTERLSNLNNLKELSSIDKINTSKSKEDLIKFAQPYRTCLIKFWEQQRDRCNKNNDYDPDIVQAVDDFNILLPKL